MSYIRKFLRAISVALLAMQISLCAQTPTTDWSIALLDQILTNVQPGQKTARMGDMDILVSNLQAWRNKLAGLPNPKSAFYGDATPWTGGNIYYTFDPTVTVAKQKVFLDCAAEWALFANLHFIPHTDQANYMTVLQETNAGDGGGASNVGMIGGQQFLWLGTNAFNHRVICHELGHTLGLAHEQQRSDRDSYITVITNNVAPVNMVMFPILTDSRNQGPYDFLSIMHYPWNAGAISPDLPTMMPLPPYSQFAYILGQGDPILTPYDRAGMALMYGAGPTLTNVVSNTQDSGPGSLRAALYFAYDHPGTTIRFNIPMTDPGFSNGVFNIQPTDSLPGLSSATILDGSTQPTNSNVNSPSILLNGVLANTASVGGACLQVSGTNCVVRGLSITGFAGLGIQLYQGAKSNLIGGTLAGAGNVISGNGSGGVVIRDLGSSANLVQGNMIGVSQSGLSAVPNNGAGIFIYNGAQSNLIGGYTAAARNIISGNGWSGVTVSDGNTIGNIIAGNYIGLNSVGTAILANGFVGIELDNGTSQNTIGGISAGSGNVISGNASDGIMIRIANPSGNVVQGNIIGLDATATTALPNGGNGIRLYGGAHSNLIGGFSSNARNIISGNGASGVLLSDANTAGNIIAGNYIGLAASGSIALPNNGVGVYIGSGAQSNIIGGTSAGAANVISGNGSGGVIINAPNASANCVQGNLIGVSPSGLAAVPNNGAGIFIYNGAQSNLIGGYTAAARNIVSGNGWSGVTLSDSNTVGNIIAGNYIGLDLAGIATLSNTSVGVELDNGTSQNTIGGSSVGAGNVISGNGNAGIMIRNPGSANNLVQGNLIGLNAARTAARPNAGAGILIYDGARSNLVGGTVFGASNLIASNSSDGVTLSDATTTNNSIRGNSIFGNSGAAIALNSSANRSIGAPSLTSAALTTNTIISGNLTSFANMTFQIDFYSSPASPAQGMTYLGSTSVTTSVGGSVSFTANLAGHVPAGRIITATATDPAGNSSAMSGGVTVTATSSVNDGIPDAWRAQYFGGNGTTTNGRSCATCDADGTGMNNWQKFLAGLNPTNSASVLKLNAVSSTASNNVASFLSAPGTVYRIQYRDDLANGFWSIAADQVVGTGRNIFIADPSVFSTPKRFYRLQVLW